MSNNYKNIIGIDEFSETIKTEDAVLIYFSHEKCNVCKVLKPKIAELLKEKYPKMKMVYSDTVIDPETAGQNSIFAVPTILTFFGGQEYTRKSRNISIGELSDAIERPYNMIF